MSWVANDNGGRFVIGRAFMPERHHIRLMRPQPGNIAANWRLGDFALARVRYDKFGRQQTRVLCAQPHPEAMAIHQRQQKNPPKARTRPQLVE